MQAFQPSAVRYVKLGRGGMWAQQALAAGTVPFGYHSVDHAPCAAGDWARVREQLIASGRTPTGASQGIREIREFYTLPDNTLWVTVAGGHVWWTFAEGPVISLENVRPDDPSRQRLTRQGWSNQSLAGDPLVTSDLSSALTRTANYRMTICEIERSDYLLRRIRGEAEPLHQQAVALQGQLLAVAAGMLAQLHWQDLETLTDLIFARDGWRRTSVLGRDQPDVDLMVEHATTRQSAWVQVKTKASQAELDTNRLAFERHGRRDWFYFVCSQPSGALTLPDDKTMQLWTGEKLARSTVDAGLLQWLIDRTR